MINTRFSRLTVLCEAPRNIHGNRMMRVQCDCGSPAFDAILSNLRRGGTKSCGCLKREQDEHGSATRTHGLSKTNEYSLWKAMRRRCYDKGQSQYHNYGGRGITVAPEWRDDFPAFLAHIGPRPSPKHSIDRIDVNGNYEPGNVRWATPDIQGANQRKCINVEYNGETMNIRQFAALVGVKYGRAYYLIARCGLTPDLVAREGSHLQPSPRSSAN